MPAVGDSLTTRAYNPDRPHHHTAGYDDYSPHGSGSQKHRFRHSELIGPVSESRIVIFPGTPAARNPHDLQAKGRGLAVRVPFPGRSGEYLFVNITNNQYATATKFADLASLAPNNPRWTQGYLSPREISISKAVPPSASGRTKRPAADSGHASVLPEYKRQPLTRDLVRVDLAFDQAFGGGLDSSFLKSGSRATHPCRVSEIYEGSIADKLGLTPGCALVIIWDDEQPWLVADLTQANARLLLAQRPVSLIFIATEACREKR